MRNNVEQIQTFSYPVQDVTKAWHISRFCPRSTVKRREKARVDQQDSMNLYTAAIESGKLY